MKVGIIGVGAIGGFIAARFVRAGFTVKALARGATLDQLNRIGLTISEAGQTQRVRLDAAADPASLGKVDLLILSVKAHALPSVAAAAAAMLRSNTVVVPAINGVPWWFFFGQPGQLGDQALLSVDPAGEVAAAIAFKHVLGCVLHMSVEQLGPAQVRHKFGQRVILGEPVGSAAQSGSARLEFVADAFETAGFEVERDANVRQQIWYKLWGNMTMNPLTALAGVTGDKVLADPLVDEFCKAIMREAAQVGERIGCAIAQSPEERNAVTAKLGAFKTSMLQDVEAGRTLEIDALLTVVREIAERLGIKTPNLDALLGMTRLFARQRGLY